MKEERDLKLTMFEEECREKRGGDCILYIDLLYTFVFLINEGGTLVSLPKEVGFLQDANERSPNFSTSPKHLQLTCLWSTI